LGELYIFLGVDVVKSILDKEQVRKLYLAGFTSPEISRRLNSKSDTIKKCIQRNFGSLKTEHQIAVTRRREVLKAVNYQANRYMGDSTFVKKNRSIYKTRPDGDIVLNKDVAPVVTWDTPRRLVNQNKNR
jgi:uncharacterized protein YjcR